MLAGPLGQRIRESARFRRRQRTLTGAVMIGLGTYLAWGNRSKKSCLLDFDDLVIVAVGMERLIETLEQSQPVLRYQANAGNFAFLQDLVRE